LCENPLSVGKCKSITLFFILAVTFLFSPFITTAYSAESWGEPIEYGSTSRSQVITTDFGENSFQKVLVEFNTVDNYDRHTYLGWDGNHRYSTTASYGGITFTTDFGYDSGYFYFTEIHVNGQRVFYEIYDRSYGIFPNATPIDEQWIIDASESGLKISKLGGETVYDGPAHTLTGKITGQGHSGTISKSTVQADEGLLASLGKAVHCFFGNDPVNLSTGNFILEKTDIKIPTRGNSP